MRTEKILIIGDSLSYNSYGYDTELRWNAHDCFPDMGSWSFRLRDELITSSRGFVFGGEPAESRMSFSHTVFGEKAFCGHNGVSLSYRHTTDTLTLYLQKHPDGGAYRIEVDGGFAAADADFKGEAESYQARAVFSVTLPADPKREVHTVSLEGEGAFTVLGISCESREVNISGRGSQTVRFFLENYDERVGRFEFDTLISILGANDIKHTPLSSFEADYAQLIEMALLQNRDAKIVLILPPDMSDPDDPDSDRGTYCSKKAAAPYMDILRRLSEKYRLQTVDTWELFENIPIGEWRYDDVHLSTLGNRMLFEKMWEIIGGKKFV